MALDLNLDGAFEKLIQRLAMRETDACHDLEEERSLMRESRTWFGLLVLEHMCVYHLVFKTLTDMNVLLDFALMEGSHLEFDSEEARVDVGFCSVVLHQLFWIYVFLLRLRYVVNCYKIHQSC